MTPFRSYLNALREDLRNATHVLDAFHVTALGMNAIDEVRRRVQQDPLHRRGHKGDPLPYSHQGSGGADPGSWRRARNRV